MKKYNLVLTHSFPTNSLILSGLISFLSKYFNVYFIDLPGFAKKTPSLKNISVDDFSAYLANEIEILNLDKYIIGCISFSYCLVSKLKMSDQCRAVIAITPFINKNSFLMPEIVRMNFLYLTKFIKLMNLYKIVWQKSILGLFFKFKEPKILEHIFLEIDPRTFVDTASIILSYSQYSWLRKPTVLIASENDNRLSSDFTKKLFTQNITDLLIIQTELDHFPDDISEKYFERVINKNTLSQIFEWLETKY